MTKRIPNHRRQQQQQRIIQPKAPPTTVTPSPTEAVRLADQLHNPRLPTARRQAIARQINQVAGNQALQRVLVQREGEGEGEAVPEYPKVVTIEGEKVAVNSEAEEKEAARIIKDIKDNYGIDVDSLKGVQAVRGHYDQAPQAVRDAVKKADWQFKELAAVERALKHFAPILGAQRGESSRALADQEITSVSKVHESITTNKASGVSDTGTLGERFGEAKNFSMFTPGTDSTMDFADNAKQLEGTAIHELAHGLMSYALDDWVAKMDFWTDTFTKSGEEGAEEPITNYGKKSAKEDMSEAAMYFFLEPETLKASCPIRHKFLEDMVATWTLPARIKEAMGEAVTAVGDFVSKVVDFAKSLVGG